MTRIHIGYVERVANQSQFWDWLLMTFYWHIGHIQGICSPLRRETCGYFNHVTSNYGILPWLSKYPGVQCALYAVAEMLEILSLSRHPSAWDSAFISSVVERHRGVTSSKQTRGIPGNPRSWQRRWEKANSYFKQWIIYSSECEAKQSNLHSMFLKKSRNDPT